MLNCEVWKYLQSNVKFQINAGILNHERMLKLYLSFHKAI